VASRCGFWFFLSLFAALSSSPLQASLCSEAIVFAVTNPVSSAADYAAVVKKETGKQAIHILTMDLSPDFAASFRADDPDAIVVRVSNPPTAEDIGRLRAYGITHLLAGPLGLETIQPIAAALQVPRIGPNPEVITSKFALQRALEKAGQPNIPGLLVQNYDEALAAYEKFGPHVVVKPNDGYGTVGVHFVNNVEQLNHAVDFSKGPLLIEKRVFGVEYFLDFVSYTDPNTGKTVHRFVNAARYRKVELVKQAPIYSSIRILPHSNEGILGRMSQQARAMLDVAGVQSGSSHNEFMLEVHDPDALENLIEGQHYPEIEDSAPIFPIELNPRMPGGNVPGYLKRFALDTTSLNQTETAVRAVTDPYGLADIPEGWRLNNHLDISFLFSPRVGRFNLNAVLALKEKYNAAYPDVIRDVVPPGYKDGDEVPVTDDLFKALGKIVIVHPDSAVVSRISREIYEACMRGDFLYP